MFFWMLMNVQDGKKDDDRSGVRTRATCVMGKFIQLKSHVLDHSTILPSSWIEFHHLSTDHDTLSIGYWFADHDPRYVVWKCGSILFRNDLGTYQHHITQPM
jgi:hypothetical protein